jgi:general secretion pathway protein D
MPNYLLIIAGCLLVTACGTQPVTPSSGHIQDEPRPAGLIPQTVRQTVLLPPPKPAAKTETYSVVVNDVPARELLFALARDAKLNIDVHPGIEGNITLNAIDQSLPQLLTRIARQVDMRYEIEGPNLTVLRDTPISSNTRWITSTCRGKRPATSASPPRSLPRAGVRSPPAALPRRQAGRQTAIPPPA